MVITGVNRLCSGSAQASQPDQRSHQHPPLHPGHRGRGPWQGGGVQHGALVEIGVEVHG